MAEAATHLRSEERGRGRRAARPSEVPLRGWKDVAVRVKKNMKLDDVPLLAAGVAFFAMLALVPTLVALVSVYGLRPEAVSYNERADALQRVWIAARHSLRDVFEQVSVADLANGKLPNAISRLTEDEDAWQPH